MAMEVKDLRFPREVRLSTARRDLGNGMALVMLYDEKRLPAYFFDHLCQVMVDGVQKRVSPILSAHQVEWGRSFHGDHVTVTPSVLCPACGTHGFIRDGKWVQA